MNGKGKYVSIDKILIREPEISQGRVKLKYLVDGSEHEVLVKYTRNISIEKVDARLMAIAPIVNYSLFTGTVKAEFPISKDDYDFFSEMMRINSIEVYVNKLIKRPEFFRKDQIPLHPEIIDAEYIPEMNFDIQENKKPFVGDGSVAILSSGGKESLLTYGIMKELGANVYPVYINESGGHWRTAKPAYDYMIKNDSNTMRVWTTVDRFYREMNGKVKVLNDRALKMWSDTYPIQLFIFPVYIFDSIPLLREFKISYVMKGDEFDDPRNLKPEYGIKHYYGIYDQTMAFDKKITEYFFSKSMEIVFFSALRGISGYVEERILFKRYPEIARLQRSCHSCHYENGDIVPCGKCSKCNGVLLFLLSNSLDARIINYKEEDIMDFKETFKERLYRLDEDEREHAIYKLSGGKKGREHDHIEKIHNCNEWCDIDYIPQIFRERIMKILGEYTEGVTYIKNNNWT